MGARAEALRWLDAGGPESLPYASLIAARAQRGSRLKAVAAVYEWQGMPLIFVADGAELGTDRRQIDALRTQLALRGDTPYLGVLFDGRLDVYVLALGGSLARHQVRLELPPDQRDQTFPVLANQRPAISSRQRGWVTDVVLRLLTQSIDALVLEGVAQTDAISLVGRALFARFLGDRGLLSLAELDVDTPAELFDTAARVGLSNAWLDKTFNGDLLPVDRKVVTGLTAAHCSILGNIMRKAPDGQYLLGWQERWDDLDFAHIPVGVLSQAYEQHLMVHAEKRRKREGGFYTPAQIAQLIVTATLRALDREQPVPAPRLLDPAVGAGVFLIVALRELVARKWNLTGKRPDTRQIREILYQQLRGFDVNEAALRFAALGLYLAAIELDPDPHPVRKLIFKENLRGRVLFRVGNPNDDAAADLGSLGPNVGPEHDGAYDIVLGNPPWSSATRLPDWPSVVRMVQAITAERAPTLAPPPLPNAILDLPFVWRATRWARPGGHIAFALHGRTLFQHAEGMHDTRRALLSSIETTSIINGAELRQTQFWPSISAPFLILFARNRTPGPDHGFRFISPRIERHLNDAGVMRIDALHSETIAMSDVVGRPYLFKALFRGSRADLTMMERLQQGPTTTLMAYWTADDNKTVRFHGNGYQTLRPSSEAREVDGRIQPPGIDASYLVGLPEFGTEQSEQVFVRTAVLPPFGQERLHRGRPRELFRGPLLLIKKAPIADSDRIQLSIVDKDVVFNETFYGYSAHGIDRPLALLRYLVLMLGSRVALWLALITSGEFGFERDVIEKATIDSIPIPPFERLSKDQVAQVEAIFQRVVRDRGAWAEADRLATELYGLTPREAETIEDTLAFNLPFAANRAAAESWTGPDEVRSFSQALGAELRPLAKRMGLTVKASIAEVEPSAPWRVVFLQIGSETNVVRAHSDDVQRVLSAADELAAAEVNMELGNGVLALARLNQKRYWTRTQARSLAQRLFWSHLPSLMEKAS